MDCPLCDSTNINEIGTDCLGRNLFTCKSCLLTYVDRKYFLDLITQKTRYDRHENYPSSGYIQFLNQCILPTIPYLLQNSKGLDYGSGPGSGKMGSVLASQLIIEHGFQMESYDPIYSPLPEIFNKTYLKTYDFLFSTEVWEHFIDPKESIKDIHKLVKGNGLIAVMTSLWDNSTDFSKWQYTKDDTHVVFFNKLTMDWLAEYYSWEIVERPIPSVWIFRKLESNIC